MDKARFIEAIDAVLARGEFPSGAAIHRQLDHKRLKGLGTDQTRWRREHLESLGWTRGPNLRDKWKAPQ